MISCLPGPLDTIVIGYPISLRQTQCIFCSSPEDLRIFLLDSTDITFPSWKYFLDWFCFLLERCVVGKSVVTSPSISYPTHTGISSRYPSTSNTVNATSVVPCIRHPYLEATQSNHPILSDVLLLLRILRRLHHGV